MKRPRLILPVLVLLGVGLSVSGYLLYRSLALASEITPGGIDLCTEFLGVGCDKTLLSSSSWFLGIPVAGWGVMYFLGVFGLLFLGRMLSEGFGREAEVGLWLLTGAGAGMSLFLAVTIVAGWVAFCPLCFVVHAVNFSVFPLVWRATGRSAGELFGGVKAGLNYIFRGTAAENRERARWKVMGFAVVILVALLSYQWIFVEARLAKGGGGEGFDPQVVWSLYEAAEVREIPVGPDDPMFGDPNGGARLVVFSNFLCPGCRILAGEINQLAYKVGDRLNVVFKSFAGMACPELDDPTQAPASCLAAWAAEAAWLQRKFWPFHDTIFNLGGDVSLGQIRQIAMDVGLDMDRFEADWMSPTVHEKIRGDIQLGFDLGIEGTPMVFLNGRQVKNLNPKALGYLIERVLESGR